jgi:cytosine/adenosine deaminase-related metal-dependent hydrolase
MLGDRDSLSDSSEPWRAEPASEAQLRKLRFYGHRVSHGVTKGRASELIEEAMAWHPEKEAEYQRWKQSEDDLAEWYYQAVMSDFCQEGDMRKPTREMVQETIAFLETTRPNWRQEIRDNAFSIVLMERYPQLERRRRI